MALTNYYEEFGLGRADSSTVIRENLNVLLLQHAKRAAFPGDHQQDALNKIELIEAALKVFHDDESKRQYDAALDQEALPESEVDWYAKALEYHDAGEFGAAHIAIRKAKQQDPGDPMLYWAAAWIYFDEEGPQALEQALREANESFVLDVDGEYRSGIEELRGEIYSCQGEFQRGIESFDRALVGAAPAERSMINWRKAWHYRRQREYQRAIECLDESLIGADSARVAEIGKQKALVYRDWSAELRRTGGYQLALELALKGLEVLVKLPDDGGLSLLLMSLVMECINELAGDNALIAFERYEEYRELILEAPMRLLRRVEILDCIEKNSERCKLNIQRQAKSEALNMEIKELEKVPKPTGYRPNFPSFAVGGAIVAFLIGVPMGQAGALFVVIAFCSAAFAGWELVKQSQWDEETGRVKEAERRISEIYDELYGIRQPLQSIPLSNK